MALTFKTMDQMKDKLSSVKLLLKAVRLAILSAALHVNQATISAEEDVSSVIRLRDACQECARKKVALLVKMVTL